MFAFSGRNYNFRCINVVFAVFLHESARTAAKSRTNFSTNSGKATKRLCRLEPNLAHMCKSIWEWIYSKQIATRDTRGQLGGGGGLGGQQFKRMWKLSDWHQLWFTSVDSSGNGHRLKPSRPSIPHGAFGGGGGRVSQIQKYWEAVKRLVRLAPKLVHICRSIWEWIYANKLPRDTQGGTWGGGGLGVKMQKSGKAVKRLDRLAPTLVHVCGFNWEWT